MRRKSIVSLIALAALAGVVALAAAPSSGQAPDQEVVEVSGGAYGLWAEVRSDLPDLLSPAEIEAIVEAAWADDAAGVTAAAESAVDPADVAGADGAEAVLVSGGPAPEVILPPTGGGPLTDSLATVDIDGETIAGLAEVATEGALGPDGFAASNATLNELLVFGVLGAFVVDTECTADLDGTEGSTTLVDAGGIISGSFPDDPPPNTPSPFNIDATFPFLGGEITVQYQTTLNEQITDGTELTVNGMHTFLSIRGDEDGAAGPEPEFVIIEVEGIASQSRCGVVAADIVDPPEPTPGPVPAAPTFAG